MIAASNLQNSSLIKQALVTVSPLEAGQQGCPQGGQLLVTCLDTDNDGICERTDEKYKEQKICNGNKEVKIDVTAEAIGANCPSGGQKVTRFFDDNNNGKLDAGESNSVSYVCNGLNWLGRSTKFAMGAGTTQDNQACPAGGTRLEFGYDNVKGAGGGYLAGGTSGVLDSGEVIPTSTGYMCNGTKALALSEVIAPGAICPAGGVKLVTCLDANANGTCDSDEISGS